MSNYDYREFEQRFYDEHMEHIKSKLKTRYEEFKKDTTARLDFKEFIWCYGTVPCLVAIVAYFMQSKDVISWSTFLTIIVVEALVLGWLWVEWCELRNRYIEEKFTIYEAPRTIYNYIWNRKMEAIQGITDITEYFATETLYSIAAHKICERSFSIWRNP